MINNDNVNVNDNFFEHRIHGITKILQKPDENLGFNLNVNDNLNLRLNSFFILRG